MVDQCSQCILLLCRPTGLNTIVPIHLYVIGTHNGTDWDLEAVFCHAFLVCWVDQLQTVALQHIAAQEK